MGVEPLAHDPVEQQVVPYEQLSLAARRQVRRCAKAGRLHADPLIAVSSADYAARAVSRGAFGAMSARAIGAGLVSQ